MSTNLAIMEQKLRVAHWQERAINAETRVKDLEIAIAAMMSEMTERATEVVKHLEHLDKS